MPAGTARRFRVYGKREPATPSTFFIAEVTSCIDGGCVYRDVNVVPRVTYEYYVSAFDADTGLETATPEAVEPSTCRIPIPPAVPEVVVTSVALDNSAYIHWENDRLRTRRISRCTGCTSPTPMATSSSGRRIRPGFIDMRG